jgi:hypothetical protein
VWAFVKHQRVQLPGGSVYNGDVVHGKVSQPRQHYLRFVAACMLTRVLIVQVHGFGKEEGPGGDSFLGDWACGLKHGSGTVRSVNSPLRVTLACSLDTTTERVCVANRYGNGDKYEGAWEAGMRHGNGRYHIAFLLHSRETAKAARITHVRFVHTACLVCFPCIRYTWPSGRYFDGMWAQAKREGPGCIVFTDKSKFDGIWIGDKPGTPLRISHPHPRSCCS